MTREAATSRIEVLEARRMALVDQLTLADSASASVSAGGGAKSYTARSVADIKAKIRFCDREIARLKAAIDGTPAPGSISTIYARFDA